MAEGDRPFNDGDIFYGSDANTSIANVRYHPTFYDTAGTSGGGVLGHSATGWFVLNGASSTLTTDTGATWATASADDGGMDGVMTTIDNNNTNAICCRKAGNETFLTTDSGDNWASQGTIITNATAGISISAPSTTVAVIGLDRGTATRGIAYSTNNGDSWTVCATGPAVDVPVIDMVDTSNGIAIDVNGNIWTTSNAGVDWSDSGQNSNTSPTITSTMIALTSTTYVMKHSSVDDFIETGTTAAGGTIRAYIEDLSEAENLASNIIKTNSGNLYCVVYFFKTGAPNTQINLTMFKSTDSGATWSVGALPNIGFGSSSNASLNLNSLDEYTTNKLIYMAGERQVMTIDESWSI